MNIGIVLSRGHLRSRVLTRLQLKVMVLLAVLASLLVSWNLPVKAEIFGSTSQEGEGFSLLKGLVSEDPEVQEETLRGLAEKADPEFLPLLNSLYDGNLNIWIRPESDRSVVILKTVYQADDEEIAYLTDPLTEEIIRQWDELEVGPDEELEMVSLASPEGRRWLQIAMNRSSLFSESPETRRSAATKIGNTGNISDLPLLHRAMAQEVERWPHHAMQEAIQQITLHDPDPERRRHAAVVLGEITGLESLPLLKSLLSDVPGETDETVRQAILDAVDRIESFQERQQIVGTLFSGLSLGSILFLMGLGLAIIFGLMGVINMAHGEMMMIGAYSAFVLQELFSRYLPAELHDFYFAVALPASFIITALVGLLLEKSVIRHLYGRPLETLLATWGVSLILQQSARWYFGDLTSVNAPTWMRGGVEVMNGLVLPYNRIFIIILGAVILLGVYLLLGRTRWGLRIRAVTQNRPMSACLGISTRRVDGWTFALGAGLAGVAGCALSLVGSVDPEMGKTYIVESFMVVVVGGVGKLAGTVVSALGIGMITKVLEPIIGGTGGAVYAKLIILGIIILFLQRRPSGLFPAKGRTQETS